MDGEEMPDTSAMQVMQMDEVVSFFQILTVSEVYKLLH